MCCGAFRAFVFSALIAGAFAQGGRGGGGGFRGGGFGGAGIGAGIGAGAGAGQGRGGKSTGNEWIALVIIAVCFVILIAAKRYENSDSIGERRPLLSEGERRGVVAAPPSAREYVSGQESAATTNVPMKVLPSGIWRGYYDQFGTTHQVCEFNLTIQSDMVQGSGVDDVGAYTLEGLYAQATGRLAFKKQYIRDSHAANGLSSNENLGHCVEYRGTCAGPELGQGVRGRWTVQTSMYSGSGVFHIWPVVDLQGPAAAEAGEAFVREHPTFEVSDDNICAVCFDRAIDVLLDPCGHIVVCAACSQRLSPRRCPICRVAVSQVLPAKRE